SVDREHHHNSGLVDLNRRKRLWCFGIGNGLADVDPFHSGNRENVPRLAGGLVDTLQTFERIEFGDFSFLKVSVQLDDSHFADGIQSSYEHSGNGKPAEVIAIVEIRHENL